MKGLRGKRVYVGLSGGVDSAVSAGLLKQAGALVTGVFIKGWYPPELPCTWAAERRDAMRVAARLSIPFLTLDASGEYKKSVIEYLLAEYRAGRTPNPDVMCNRDIKFGAFYRFAKEGGADAIATGHYALLRQGSEGHARLYRGADKAKDQSYFLWAVPAAILRETLFPIGALQKRAVRALARQMRLPVAEKKDSQGLCFLGSVSVKDFLRQELGTANPALLHTLGERIDGRYVVAKDVERGELALAPAPAPTEGPLTLSEANWFFDPSEATEGQYRYHGPLVKGRASAFAFSPDRPIGEPVAQGQSLVCYRGASLIGGAIIS